MKCFYLFLLKHIFLSCLLAYKPLEMKNYCSSLLGRRHRHPTPVLLSGQSLGWRSLVGCSPWGCWELDTTEWLHFHFSLSCIGEGNGNPLQYSCLENPRDRGAWWAAVYGVGSYRVEHYWSDLAAAAAAVSLLRTEGETNKKICRYNCHTVASYLSFFFLEVYLKQFAITESLNFILLQWFLYLTPFTNKKTDLWRSWMPHLTLMMTLAQSWALCVQSLSCVWLFVTLWTVACQAPLSMEFPRQGYWSGLSFPSPGYFSDPGIEPVSLASPALAGKLYHWATWEGLSSI